MQLLQLYAAAAVVGGLAHCTTSKSPALGASTAVNAVVVFSAIMNPYATFLIYGILPAPAWLLASAWIAYDVFGATRGGGTVANAGHLGGAAVGAAAFYALKYRIW